MSVGKMAKLVERLEDLTQKGKIEWEETEKENAFLTSFTDFSIRLSKEFDREEGTYFYLLALVDSKGRELENTTDWLLRTFLERSESRLADLYDKARSTALGVEQILDNVLIELGEKDGNPS